MTGPALERLAAHGIRLTPVNVLELGDTPGSARGTTPWKIELPLARPTLLVGLNPCVLLSLAMVMLAGLVGAGGIGSEVTRGLTRMKMGAGRSIVAIALLLDRLSRVALDRRRCRAAPSRREERA